MTHTVIINGRIHTITGGWASWGELIKLANFNPTQVDVSELKVTYRYGVRGPRIELQPNDNIIFPDERNMVFYSPDSDDCIVDVYFPPRREIQIVVSGATGIGKSAIVQHIVNSLSEYVVCDHKPSTCGDFNQNLDWVSDCRQAERMENIRKTNTKVAISEVLTRSP